MTPFNKLWIKIPLVALIVFAVFVSGIYIGKTGTIFGKSVAIAGLVPVSDATNAKNNVDLEKFWKVWGILNQKFVSASSSGPVSDEDKVRGAIAGLVKSYGDPYTMYFPPKEAEQFQDTIAGNFSGVGMEVGMRKGIITIIAPLPGTPAEKSGLITGDAIVSIDGKSTDGMSIDEAVHLIRGEKGSKVKLAIYREGDTEFRKIEVTRDTIDIPTVKTETKDDTFIISLYSFNAVSDTKMEEAMNAFVASKKDKLILDLRGNPGGFMQSAVDIASFYMPAGKIVVRERAGAGGEDKVFRTRNRQVKEFNPKNFVVLVDGGSASASEILAGALHDHSIATILGVNTFGKGSVQELVDLGDKSSVKVTIARWFTPNDISISNGGLTPNIIIKRSPKDREDNKDPQKDAAIRFLKGEDVKSESLTTTVSTSTTSGH
jgi:carboxyl-terminal processing protease